MSKNNLILTSVSMFVSFAAFLAFVACTNFQSGTLTNNTGRAQAPKLTLLSTTKVSVQDSISSVGIMNSGDYIATQVVYGQLRRFDKASKTWNPVESFGRSDWPLNSIYFLDAMNGFIAGNNGTLFRTSDGGQSWTQAPRFTNYNLGKIMFSNSLNGYIAAELTIVDKNTGALTSGIEIFRTDDGGDHWKKVYKNEKKDVAGLLFDIAVRSPNVCLLAIKGGPLLRTGDGGNTWQPISSVDRITSITFTLNGIGWLVSELGDFLRSDDEGRTWYKPKDLSADFGRCQWESIDISKSEFGVAVSEDGCIAYTNDGKNWEKINTSIKDHLRNVVTQGPRGLILSAQNIYEISF